MTRVTRIRTRARRRSSPVRDRLNELLWGYRVSQALFVAVQLGIAERLADGPRELRALARRSGVDPVALESLMRALASVGVFRQRQDGRYAHTALSRGLIRGRPSSLGAATMMWMQDHYAAWGHLLDSIRTGEAAFPRSHGTDFYRFLRRDHEAAARFAAAIGELTSHEARSVVPDYDFGRARTVVDVGGGQGDMLAAVLEAVPGATGVLFDQPAVIRTARARLARNPAAGRVRFVAGDFFRSIPRGGDVYVLRWILHNWNDRDAARILRQVQAAMPRTARLLVIEELVPDRPRADWRHASSALGDLNMLVLLGGHERTRAEYRGLLAGAGLRLRRVVAGKGYGILEAVPAPRPGRRASPRSAALPARAGSPPRRGHPDARQPALQQLRPARDR